MRVTVLKLKKYWRVILALQKTNFMTTAAYRQNFIIMTIAVAISMTISLIFLKVIFGYINNLSGWSYYEIMIILGSVMIVEGILWIFGARVGALGRNIRLGLLDGLLIKPIDSQVLISFWECDHEDISRVVIGGALVGYGVANLHLSSQAIAVNLFFYLLLIANATIITYSITIILKTAFFWTIADYSLYNVMDALSDISKYPTDIFLGVFWKTVFTFLLPLAFVATVPAKVLARGFDWKWVLGSFVMAAIFFILARRFWLFGLKHYKSASS